MRLYWWLTPSSKQRVTRSNLVMLLCSSEAVTSWSLWVIFGVVIHRNNCSCPTWICFAFSLCNLKATISWLSCVGGNWKEPRRQYESNWNLSMFLLTWRYMRVIVFNPSLICISACLRGVHKGLSRQLSCLTSLHFLYVEVLAWLCFASSLSGLSEGKIKPSICN